MIQYSDPTVSNGLQVTVKSLVISYIDLIVA